MHILWDIPCPWIGSVALHDDVIKWKHFPRHWPFVRGIHRSTVNSPHKGQWRGALMFFLICVWINGWVNNREAGDLRRYLTHYNAIVMKKGAWKLHFYNSPPTTPKRRNMRQWSQHWFRWWLAAKPSIEPLGINFSETWIKIQNLSHMKMHLIISSAKWQPFCSGACVKVSIIC